MAAVYADIDVYREIAPGADNPSSRWIAGIVGGKEDTVFTACPHAITEAATCTVDDESVEPEASVQALLEVQGSGIPCTRLLETADPIQNASVQKALVAVSLERRE